MILFLAGAAETQERPRAEDNFTWHCVQCHGPRGDGKGINNTRDLPVAPRNLSDGKDMAQFSDEDMVRTITHGGGVNDLSSIMPPWGNLLPPDEIKDLVAHVRKLFKCQFDPKAKEAYLRREGKLPPAGGEKK